MQQKRSYDLFPVQEGDKQKIFEYALVLKLKLAKTEYADFIRGITPIVIDLLEEILEKRCGVKLVDCCAMLKSGILIWNTNELKGKGLQDILDREYAGKGGFKGGVVYSSHIAGLIRAICKDKKLIERVNAITKIEGQVRNVAAHEIVSVTEEWIQKKTGKTVGEIFEIIKYLVGMAGIKANEEAWNSYDRMNALIIQKLDLLS